MGAGVDNARVFLFNGVFRHQETPDVLELVLACLEEEAMTARTARLIAAALLVVLNLFASAALAQAPTDSVAPTPPSVSFQIGGGVTVAYGDSGSVTVQPTLSQSQYGMFSPYGAYPYYGYSFGQGAPMSHLTGAFLFQSALGEGSGWGVQAAFGDHWADSVVWQWMIGFGELVENDIETGFDVGYRRTLRRLVEPPPVDSGPAKTADRRLAEAWRARGRQESFAKAQHPETLAEPWAFSPVATVGPRFLWHWLEDIGEDGQPMAGMSVALGGEAIYRDRFSIGLLGTFGGYFPVGNETDRFGGHARAGFALAFSGLY